MGTKKGKSRSFLILAINPGSTSTKIALFENATLQFEETIRHSRFEIEQFAKVWDQYEFRKQLILDAMETHRVDLHSLTAVVGRGGLLKSIPGGTYTVNQAMIDDARAGVQGEHPSNLGCILAYGIAWDVGCKAFIVDPPSVDEFEPLARYSGLPELPRRSLSHALNIHAVARVAARAIRKSFHTADLIVAHLGGGISICPVRRGRIVDANDASSGGPFTPERSGSLPLQGFIDLCFSGAHTREELRKKVMGRGGLVAYLGVNSAAEVEEMAAKGDERAREIYEAMAYQIAKEIGAMATVLEGRIDAIVLTGGLAHSRMLVKWIKDRVGFIARVLVYPGEDELQALALGAYRVLKGEEEARTY
jgi:butyrate kinase